MLGPLIRTSAPRDMGEFFHLGDLSDYPFVSDAEVSPGSLQPIIRRDRDTGNRAPVLMNWGLVPAFADRILRWTPSAAFYTPAKYITEHTVYRRHFEARRCLIPVDGLFAWSGGDETTQNRDLYRLQMRNLQPFALAGLWEARKNLVGDWIESFTVLTTEAVGTKVSAPQTLPLVLDPKDCDRWLDRGSNASPPFDLVCSGGVFPRDGMWTKAEASLRAGCPEILGLQLSSYKPWSQGYSPLTSY